MEGCRLILQALTAGAHIKMVCMTVDYAESISGRELKQMLEEKNILIETASENAIERICDSQNNQGIIAVMPLPEYEPMKDIPRYSLYLDDISDPGNMGTLLRTAAWFGIDSVFLSDGCVDPFNSKVIRSGMGAHFSFKHLLPKSSEWIFKKCMDANISIIGSDKEGDSVDNLPEQVFEKWILIIGSEANGISDSIKTYINYSISVPGFSDMESLNVAVAGGILLYSLRMSK